MEKVYMVCDYTDEKAASIEGRPDVGVEFLGNCSGRILRENGTEIGRHHSSSFGFLRSDLRHKLDNPDNYEIVDLIGQPVPTRFQTPENRIADLEHALVQIHTEAELGKSVDAEKAVGIICIIVEEVLGEEDK